MHIFSHQLSNFRPSILTIWYTWTDIVVIMMSVFRIKRCSVRLYTQLFVHSGVQHIMCCVVLFVFFVWFVFVLCLVFPMLSVSLVCAFLIAPSVFSNVYLFGLSSSCVLCTQCFQFHWFVCSCLPLLFSPTFICFVCLRLVSCVPNVVSFSGLSILPCPFDVFYRLEYESVFFLKILCK